MAEANSEEENVEAARTTVWKWWNEERRNDGLKWHSLKHKGPLMAPAYVRLPSEIKFWYDREHLELSEKAEEAAGFYARMIDHDYTTKEVFNSNFMKDWREKMTPKEKEKITDLSKCNFKQLHDFYVKQQKEDSKTTHKQQKEDLIAEYGWCTMDGHRQGIANFKVEPPQLFRGRGEHPMMGKIKKRIMPEDITINCSLDSVPQPPEGHEWGKVQENRKMSWLACWKENIQDNTRYMKFNAASKLKGEADLDKYDTARKLHKCIDEIKQQYKLDWESEEEWKRQCSVASYFIDTLALRPGQKKNEEEQADTVGCCSLKVEHISLHEQKDGKKYVVIFDFLGKDAIRYYKEVSVEEKVFTNLQRFQENKQKDDALFDSLNTRQLNKYLKEQNEKPWLTARVFRTYHASRTLQEELEKNNTDPDATLFDKVSQYNKANRVVEELCNHKRAAPKNFYKRMENLKKKIDDKMQEVEECKRSIENPTESELIEINKKLGVLQDKINKLKQLSRDEEKNKNLALATSKLNYIDPRISVAWCKKFNVPIEKIYTKAQRHKFQWAIDMNDAEYDFLEDPMNRTDNGSSNDEESEPMDVTENRSDEDEDVISSDEETYTSDEDEIWEQLNIPFFESIYSDEGEDGNENTSDKDDDSEQMDEGDNSDYNY